MKDHHQPGYRAGRVLAAVCLSVWVSGWLAGWPFESKRAAARLIPTDGGQAVEPAVEGRAATLRGAWLCGSVCPWPPRCCRSNGDGLGQSFATSNRGGLVPAPRTRVRCAYGAREEVRLLLLAT